MSGGLMQLVAKGAQDQLVNGNPSFTHFRSVYKRHTDFAMEHFQLVFKTTNLQLPPSGSLTLRAKVERYAQLIHDCYLVLTLPDIYSPVVPVSQTHPNLNASSNAVGYQFNWIRNIGYNMINHIAVLINGQEIVRHTGEWMKIYADLKFNGTKKALLNQMVGNVPEVYDPANAYGCMNQYPHSISTATSPAERAIAGRTLTIPLHFWFCEEIGKALPLIALQHSEVEIVVDLKNMYQLFTTLDVRETINGSPNSNFGKRIAPDASSQSFQMNNFLSPPTYSTVPSPTNPTLTTWGLNPYIEANYIWLNDVELAHIAKTEHSFIVTQIDVTSKYGQYGASNDMELTMRNLCTQVVWVAQRSDRDALNDYDNYTNWEDPFSPPLDSTGLSFFTPQYTSGNALPIDTSRREILTQSALVLNGKERFGYKNAEFFSELQNFRHHKGVSTSDIPGIYSYSFALEHYNGQPSGHLNGSQFDRTTLRNSYIQPSLSVSPTQGNTVCILKSSAQNPNPTVVNPNAVNAQGQLLYGPKDIITIVRKTDAQTLSYSYNVRAFVESYNFVRVMGGVANVVFSS
uniref:Major capsid protein N-terminal domain-containing protein n=1 Tax=viral metagenome TaxID=1070528 RepID=A0A6C0F6V9_9ZZZZ